MLSFKFNDEIINIDENNNIYDLNLFTNENYYTNPQNLNIGMYYNNTNNNDEKYNEIIKDKIINKIIVDYKINIDELNINDTSILLIIKFIYNNQVNIVTYNKRSKTINANIPMNIINRNENIHISDYLYYMNIYFSNKYKQLENNYNMLIKFVIILSIINIKLLIDDFY